MSASEVDLQNISIKPMELAQVHFTIYILNLDSPCASVSQALIVCVDCQVAHPVSIEPKNHT